MITISDIAVRRLKEVLAQHAKPEDGLRVKVIGGGCSGLQYRLDLDAPKPGDKVFERDGVKVIIDRKSFLYVTGSELVYKDGLMDTGFQLDNPNVKRTCGCGASFSV
jgi:iron-sulfur cluster assembly protein